jgi:hypothetical protein
MTTKLAANAAAAVVMLAAGLSLIPTIALATGSGPTNAQLNALVTAESNVISLAKHYAPTAAWAKHFKAAEAKQSSALTKVNAALAPTKPITTTTAPAKPTTTTTELVKTTTTVSTDLSEGAVSGLTWYVDPNVGPSAGNLRVAVGTLSITIVDTATGQTIGTWTNGTYSALSPGPVFALDELEATPPTDTLTLEDPSPGGSQWTGPSTVTVSDPDLSASEIGVSASFSGMPGYGPSKSSTVAL